MDISHNPIAAMIRTTRPLFPSDPLTRAATLLRASGGVAAPVVSGNALVGVVREADLLRALASAGVCAVDLQAQTPVSGIMAPPTVLARPDCTIGQAANLFAESGAEMLPVVTDVGAYAGYLLRSDISAALGGAIRPPSVGGLATPLGVHLTCGSQSGGVGSTGLVLLGVLFGLLNIVGFAVPVALAWAAQRWLGQPLYSALLSEPLSQPNIYDAITWLAIAGPALAVLAGIRFLPVAGYHAAEHQTVHAIEQGEPLEPPYVTRMPRVHPRCGTNLAAAAAIFTGLITAFPSPIVVLAAIMIVLLAWKSIGGWLQYYVTTRPASPRQIKSGIRAGKELLEHYREEALGLRPPGRRIWNLGFVQIALGLTATILAAQAVQWLLQRFLGIRLPLL